MRFLFQLLVTCHLAVVAPALGWGLPLVAEPVGRELRLLAARAEKKPGWPPLRRYAASRKDPERRGLAYFVLGYREYEAGGFATAAADLHRAARTGFSLVDFAEYYEAAAAQKADQSSQALEALSRFSLRHPESTLRFDALALLARVFLQTGQAEQAIRVLSAEPRIRQRPALALLLAQAYRQLGQLPAATRSYQEIYYAFPTSPESDKAAEALSRVRTELGGNFPEVTEEIQTARAHILTGRARWQEAEEEFAGLLQSRPTSSFAARWRIGRARCLIRLRQAGQAIDVLSSGARLDSDLDAQRLQLLVDAYLQNSDTTAATQVFDLLRGLYPQSDSYAWGLWAMGNFHVRQGDWKEAARYYQPLAESFPQTDHGREASWRLAWASYLDGDLAGARTTLTNHLARYPDSERAAGILFWLGRIAEQQGGTTEARALYKALRRRFVQSYYALLASFRLGGLATPSGERPGSAASALDMLQKIPPRKAPPVQPCESPPPSELMCPSLTLRELSLADLAAQNLVTVLADQPHLAELRLALSRLRAEQLNTAAALIDARKVVPRGFEYEFADLPEEIWRLLYPRDYWPLVRRRARANGLDPYLVMGLIRQESAFNPRATSSADARGLMQILPQTVSASRRGRARAARRLYDPSYNVRFGTRYLRRLLKTFNGNTERALAAYNAGDTRVKEWLSKRPFLEPAEFVETIPVRETRRYVEAVLRDAAIYRQLLTRSAKLKVCRPAPRHTAPKKRGTRSAGL